MSTTVKTRQVTHTVVILDQSGSMQSRKQFAVDAWNEQVSQAKINSADQDITLSLLTFNGSVFEHKWMVPAQDVPMATEEGYVCDGSTALNDAVGYAIEKLLATTDSNDPNTAYMLQVITDGEENSSRMYPRGSEMVKNENGLMVPENKLNKLCERVQAVGRWTISFLGCSADYLKQLSGQMATPVANMAAWSPSNVKAAVYGTSKAVGEYYKTRQVGLCAVSNMHSDNSQESGDLADADGDVLEKAVKTSGGVLMQHINSTTPKVQCFSGSVPPVDWGALHASTTNKTS